MSEELKKQDPTSPEDEITSVTSVSNDAKNDDSTPKETVPLATFLKMKEKVAKLEKADQARIQLEEDAKKTAEQKLADSAKENEVLKATNKQQKFMFDVSLDLREEGLPKKYLRFLPSDITEENKAEKLKEFKKEYGELFHKVSKEDKKEDRKVSSHPMFSSVQPTTTKKDERKPVKGSTEAAIAQLREKT